jgi:pimeloyl-[acyl-carrier protein] synthase
MTTTMLDLTDPAFLTNPYPIYRQLQKTEPAYKMPINRFTSGVWLITRYADVSALFREAHFSNDMSRVIPADQLPGFSKTMIFRDPPDHTRLRSLVSQAFTAKRVRDLEPRIAAIADDLIARARPRGTMDFIAEFAALLPSIVIAELLGVPSADQPQFQAMADAIARGADHRATAEDQQGSRDAISACATYFQGLIDERRRQPQDDFLTSLLAARDVQDRLSEDELLETCSLILLAGYETTVRLLGNGLFTLLSHPDQLALLRQQPALLPRAIEEMLRFESPVQQAVMRITTEPVEISGRSIPAGEMLSAVIGAANRDPAQFPDPDRFDITRDPNRHIAFATGIHFCLGAPLARTEARVAFARLFEQLPNLRLVHDEGDWIPSTRLRGLQSLAITF